MLTVLRRVFLSVVALCALSVSGQEAPKREFRGAWLHVVGPVQYHAKTTDQAKQYIIKQLDLLKNAGCNAVIFQVRPTADALYQSEIEPWSGYLTGTRGKAPDPLWDPMEFTIGEAHKRGMEFHAWLNPYRVTLSSKESLPASHDANKYPERFMRYNGQVLFDPAYQENRDYIEKIVRDIVKRYDVDAVHFDDYFYPYPGKTPFNADAASYEKFGNGMNINDWRRHNVDLLIEQLSKAVKEEKPWVRFGISPFGIWRNKKCDPRGSDTNGLQNYDDLYADVIMWSEKGWVDYVVPQLYWELDHKAASSRKLAQWWNDHAGKAQLYLGQDVKRTMDACDASNGHKSELATKVDLSRKLPNVDGNVWWHGYWVTDNYKGAADSLALTHQSTIALPPAFGDQNVRPKPVEGLKIEKEGKRNYLIWTPPAEGKKESSTDAVKFVVYQFYPDEQVDTGDPNTIIALTSATRVLLPDDATDSGTTLIVTSLDRMNRESRPAILRR